MTSDPTRLDAVLVATGRARSRRHAHELVTGGQVSVGGSLVTRPARPVGPGDNVVVATPVGPQYASRGALKLLGALEEWGDLAPEGRVCLDAGASTGGFTDVLLRKGARLVHAVDVGHGQLVPSLRDDARVLVREGVNVRDLRAGSLDPVPDLVVGDLAFISLTLVLEPLIAVAGPGADLVLLVKPQFEVGRERLGSGGVVRSAQLREEAVLTVIGRGFELGLGLLGVVASPQPGSSGNVEYFVRWTAPGAESSRHNALVQDPASCVAQAIAAGPTGSVTS